MYNNFNQHAKQCICMPLIEITLKFGNEYDQGFLL